MSARLVQTTRNQLLQLNGSGSFQMNVCENIVLRCMQAGSLRRSIIKNHISSFHHELVVEFLSIIGHFASIIIEKRKQC